MTFMSCVYALFLGCAAAMIWLLSGLVLINAAESLFTKYRRGFNRKFGTDFPLVCPLFEDFCYTRTVDLHRDNSLNWIFGFRTFAEILWPLVFLFLVFLITCSVVEDLKYLNAKPSTVTKKPDDPASGKDNAEHNHGHAESGVVAHLGDAGADAEQASKEAHDTGHD